MKIQVKEGGMVVEGRKGGLSKWRERDFSRERYVCIDKHGREIQEKNVN